MTIIAGPSDPAAPDRAALHGRFRFFFRADTSKLAPADLTDSDDDGVPDFVATQLQALVRAYRVFTHAMGLPDFFEVGHLARQGIRFLDVLLDDIPVQRGLASARVSDTTPAFAAALGHQGPSVTLRLHRGLHAGNLTVAHELFHVFQYACLPFLNMWFMEGLARHGQRWLDTRPLRFEALPVTQPALEDLLRKWHDAEYFWSRLSALCGAAGSPAHCDANPHAAHSRFMAVFFGHAARQIERMRQEAPARQLPGDAQWPGHERRSGANNRYILRAAADTVDELATAKPAELKQFVALVHQLDAAAPAQERLPEVQAFLGVLQSHGIATVRRHADGHLVCDHFDPVLGVLSAPEVKFEPASLTNEALDSFKVVRTLIGNLRIEQQPQLDSLAGLGALVAVEGSLSLIGTGLTALRGLDRLERVKGTVEIRGNHAMKSIDAFHALVSIDQSLLIADHPVLAALSAFGQLREIKKGALTLQAAPQLDTVQGFAHLAHAREVHWEKLAVRDVDCLKTLFSRHPEFPGRIRFVACRLEHVRAMAGVRSIASSLYLHGNRLASLEGLEALQRVGGSLSLSTNRLRDLSALHRLEAVGGMLGVAYNRLDSLGGLEALQSLGTVKWGTQTRTLVTHGNPGLKDITALRNVRTADHYLVWYCDDPRQYTARPAATDPFHENILQIHDVAAQRPVPTCQYVGKESHSYARFRATTHNKRLTYLHDFETPADTLVLSFSGVAGKLGGVFHNRYPLITEGRRTHKIFINDTDHLWYHGGIPGITASMQETLRFLRALRDAGAYRKVVCIGASMGGYMALLTGHQLQATDILAFAPQIFLDPGNRRRYGDTRWAHLLKRLPRGIPDEFLDLSLLYRTPPAQACAIDIHYSTRLALDDAQVRHLGPVPGLTLHPYDVEDHYISIHLDKQGALNPLVDAVLRRE